MKHTPGPWVWVDEYPINVKSSTGEFIATTTPNGRNPFQEDVYNARLIAAAPEMLAALKYVVSSTADLHPHEIDSLRRVIAKAEGE